MRIENKPLYPHPCPACKFLGTFDGHDLYVCGKGTPGERMTVIARYGAVESDYASGMVFGTMELTDEWCEPPLRVAYLIAKDLGLVK